MTNMKVSETEFDDLMKEHIQLPTRPSTFFDICGLTFKEYVFSNLYAYYLNPIADHGLRDIFLNAMCELIREKTGVKPLENTSWVTIQQEVRTDTGNFIDLVVIEPIEGSNAPGHALVIENKINASLYNDLNDYFNHVKVPGRKTGVVLSLQKQAFDHSAFVNITHGELMSKIITSLNQTITEIDTKQLFFIREFITHLQSLSMTQNLTSQYAFYFQYEEKIHAICKLEQMIKSDLFSQLSITCDKLGLKLGAPYHSSLRYFISSTQAVYYTIWMPDLFTPSHCLTIIVELDKKGIEYLESINKIEFTQEEKLIIKEVTKVRSSYLHYASTWFNLTTTEMEQFSISVYQKIMESPLHSIFAKIEGHLSAAGLPGS